MNNEGQYYRKMQWLLKPHIWVVTFNTFAFLLFTVYQKKKIVFWNSLLLTFLLNVTTSYLLITKSRVLNPTFVPVESISGLKVVLSLLYLSNRMHFLFKKNSPVGTSTPVMLFHLVSIFTVSIIFCKRWCMWCICFLCVELTVCIFSYVYVPPCVPACFYWYILFLLSHTIWYIFRF